MTFTPFGPLDGDHLLPGDVLALHEDELRGLSERGQSCLIVGRGGVGKTCVLHRLCRVLERHGTQVIFQQDTPGSDYVSRFDGAIPRTQQIDVWARLWRAATVCSYATYALCGPGRLSLSTDEELGIRGSPLLEGRDNFHAPTRVWTQVREIIKREDDGGSLRTYVESHDWAAFEERLLLLLARSGPVWMVVDLRDDYMSLDPGAWMRAQKGLLAAVRSLNNSPLGQYLRLVVSARETHLVDDVGPEQKAGVIVLETDDRTTITFGIEKLRALEPSDETGAGGVARLLASAGIANGGSPVVEDALEYIVRHTRAVPRDFVITGNELANAWPAAAPPDARHVRRTVRGCSRWLAEAQEQVCIDQLIARLPEGFLGEEDVMTETSTARRGINKRLSALIDGFVRGIGRNRFAAGDLVAGLAGYEAFLPDLADVLWRNRLLGYEPAVRQRQGAGFFSLRCSSRQLPESPVYVFHPCVTDLHSLGRNGAAPVQPTSELC